MKNNDGETIENCPILNDDRCLEYNCKYYDFDLCLYEMVEKRTYKKLAAAIDEHEKIAQLKAEKKKS